MLREQTFVFQSSYRALVTTVRELTSVRAEPRAGSDELRPGRLVTYGGETADHVAFWLGAGRILHATEPAGVDGVVEEDEPAALCDRRRAFACLEPALRARGAVASFRVRGR